MTPAKGAFSAEGKLTLRNDSQQPQKSLSLQISSSLDWNSITLGDRPVQWLGQPYESDIDHTGRLSEAIITLPIATPPGGTVELNVNYSGEITRDATRLLRLGMPESLALNNDWDQLSDQFTAVRGIGYVAWYPVALNAVSLSEGSSVFDALARWQDRSHASTMTVRVNKVTNATLISNGQQTATAPSQITITFGQLSRTVPTFAFGDYQALERPALTVQYLPQHSSTARDWTLAIEKRAPMISQWFGPPEQKVAIVDLADENASAFDAGPVLFAPLRTSSPNAVEQLVAPTLTHAAVNSNRRWISEGLGQFAQMLTLEDNSGRIQAVRQLSQFAEALAHAEQSPSAAPSRDSQSPQPATPQSLITTADPAFYRTKAMFVWWMLRDMLGDVPLQRALAAYRASDDKEPSYIQHLLELQAKRSLEQFFDDWVYRDNGLPDFKIDTVYPRKTLGNSYIATITVANLGRAGAEVPVTVRAPQGERSARLLVPANQKATVRIEIAAYPTDVAVNDGSVPESDLTNNSFPVPKPQP